MNLTYSKIKEYLRMDSDTMSKTIYRDFSMYYGYRFYMHDDLMDIYTGINSLKSDEKFKNVIKKVTITNVFDYELYLIIYFKDGSFIKINSLEIINRYKVLHYNESGEFINPGLISSILSYFKFDNLLTYISELIISLYHDKNL